ncbi:MAG: hypothetical protein LH614_21370 [Pyrinomonadaceae bacterium]|nr:hypothetical protein [Pyrinomonadaceae bacterium]
MFALLFEVTNTNLLMGFMPESFGLLIFGGGLIGLAVGLRRLLNWKEKVESRDFSAGIDHTTGEI